jgi:hypothetical protein
MMWVGATSTTDSRSLNDLKQIQRMRASACVLLLMVMLISCEQVPSRTYDAEDVPIDTLRKSAEQFFVIRAADLFYPHGAPEDLNVLPLIEDKEAGEIEGLLNEVLELVLTIHRSAADDIQRRFGQTLVLDPKVAVRLSRNGIPISQVRVKSHATSTVEIDIRVVQAMFRSIIVGAATPVATPNESPEMAIERMRRKSDPLSAANERAAILNYLALVEWIRTGASPAKVTIGDMQVSGPLFGGETIDMGDFRKDPKLQTILGLALVMQLEQRFLDILGFLLAHEGGHVVLMHNDVVRNRQGDCELFQSLELQADEYATWLLGFYSGDERSVKEGVLGYRDFFRFTYEIAGFESYRPEVGCSHPTVDVRVEALDRVGEDINVERLMGNQAVWKRKLEERRKTGVPPEPKPN